VQRIYIYTNIYPHPRYFFSHRFPRFLGDSDFSHRFPSFDGGNRRPIIFCVRVYRRVYIYIYVYKHTFVVSCAYNVCVRRERKRTLDICCLYRSAARLPPQKRINLHTELVFSRHTDSIQERVYLHVHVYLIEFRYVHLFFPLNFKYTGSIRNACLKYSSIK